jgi:hypothetical protein
MSQVPGGRNITAFMGSKIKLIAYALHPNGEDVMRVAENI